jgi:hypothetical protein
MGLDIRIPIGLMFQILGILMVIYGLLTKASPIYSQRSLGLNINLWWGGVILAFGIVMFALGRRGDKRN